MYIYTPPAPRQTSGSRCPIGHFCVGGAADKAPCTAAPGSYCAEGSADPAGGPCPAGAYCAGGAADKAPCTAAAGVYCAEGSADPAGGAACPAGAYCVGFHFLPQAGPHPINYIT